MARNKPERPIIPPPPRNQPRPEVSIRTISLVCQLAQDGLAALLAKGVPMEKLEAHAAALAALQRQVGIHEPPPAKAEPAPPAAAKAGG
jgi:hypothetical protein